MANVGDVSYNATCVYPLSGQYCILQRSNYYALLVFAIFAQNHNWLLSAALGTVVTYAGVTAIHTFVLAITASRRTMVVDLDIVGCLIILFITNSVIWPLLHFNRTLRLHRLRRLFKVWCLFVSIGTICAANTSIAVIRPPRQHCILPFTPHIGNISLGWQNDLVLHANTQCNLTCYDPAPYLRSSSDLQILNLADMDSANYALSIFRYFSFVVA